MSTAPDRQWPRVSRGFHRLGLFLAAIPLLVGGVFSYFQALDEASRPPAELSKPALRIEGFGTVPMPPDFDRLMLEKQNEMVDQIAVSLRPHWWIKFAEALALSLFVTLTLSAAVYGVVRAIGWVIGGFAA